MKQKNKKIKLSIIGINGLPANYGGFETLAENLVKYSLKMNLDCTIYVFCSSQNYQIKNKKFLNSHLIYLPIAANGLSSILYDGLSLIYSGLLGCDIILMLGYSGSIFLPFFKFIHKARVLINIDGIEWNRSKWNPLTKFYLKLSEYLSVIFADLIIVDNLGIKSYLCNKYKVSSTVISYGGEHAFNINEKYIANVILPKKYALTIARIEPENNIEMIIKAFKKLPSLPLLIIGNFSSTLHGKEIKKKYACMKNIIILDSIYDLGKLKTIRIGADIYIHGHSAGGTNPSLVEMMYFGVPIIAYDCIYNRYTMNDEGFYFKTTNDLVEILNKLNCDKIKESGLRLQDLAKKEYTWHKVGSQYFNIILNSIHKKNI